MACPQGIGKAGETGYCSVFSIGTGVFARASTAGRINQIGKKERPMSVH